MENPTTNPPNPEDALRPHTYDGIREFDKRLPNWWLMTLYLAIAFWVGYWAYYQWWREGPSSSQRIEQAMTRIEAEKLAAVAATRIDDPSLWQMSRNPVIVDAGRATFTALCVPCHKASLRGVDDGGIGADLRLQVWIHGGRPTDIFHTVTTGVPVKGMPTWGPILGPKKISEVVAYVLSYHREGEPMSLRAAVPAPR
jgi:cytochrome c oxidase cbb3-type subunit 3